MQREENAVYISLRNYRRRKGTCSQLAQRQRLRFEIRRTKRLVETRLNSATLSLASTFYRLTLSHRTVYTYALGKTFSRGAYVKLRDLRKNFISWSMYRVVRCGWWEKWRRIVFESCKVSNPCSLRKTKKTPLSVPNFHDSILLSRWLKNTRASRRMVRKWWYTMRKNESREESVMASYF